MESTQRDQKMLNESQLDDNIIELSKRQQLIVEQSIKTQIKYYKSARPFYVMSIILTFSSFQFGYALCEVSTVPILTLISIFDIPLTQGIANGLLVGIMPVGGIFGSALNTFMMRHLSRKNIHYVLGVVNVISTVLIQITTFETIMIGRLMLGMCCGIYTFIAPQFVKQLSPPPLRTLFGAFFSLGRIIGIMVCYAMGLIFQVYDVDSYWRIMFVVPGFLSVLQAILVFIYLPDSPVQLAANQQIQRLRAMYVQIVMKEYTIENQIVQRRKTETLEVNLGHVKDPLEPNKKRAFYMAIHLAIYRQMMGVNTIVAFAGIMIKSVDPDLALYANLLLNSIQGFVTVIATFWVGTVFGRRPLHLYSSIIIGASSYLIGIGYIVNSNMMIIVFMFLYMIIFGLIYSPISWSYQSEIIPPVQAPICNIYTWISLALTMLVPPIIIQKMDGDAYPVFIYFGVYITISLVYMWNGLVQTKGKKYQEIIQQY